MKDTNLIDTGSWNLFLLSDLFTITHGTRLRKQDMRDGTINYIGASAFNNGITAKIGNTEYLHPAGTITVCYNGSIGQAFYQTEQYWATDDVNILYPKFSLTPKIAQFLIPVIYKLSLNYAYVDKWTAEKMQSTQIPLPATPEGKPDWEYMEHYIEGLREKAHTKISLLMQLYGGGYKCLKINEWRRFKVGELFPIIIKPAVYHSYELKVDNHGIPYVVRSKFNNGIKCRVKNENNIKCNPAGVISFGAENSSFFYQKEAWCSGRDLYYIDSRHLSPQVCLFIAACLQTLSTKYAYNYGLFPDLLKEEYIKLPVDQSGSPDWKYMENYIDNLMSKSRQTISLLS